MAVRGFTFDNTTLFKAAGAAVTTSAAIATIIDLMNGATLNTGVEVPRFDGIMVIDVSAIDIASANETYDIILQVSSSATFASAVLNSNCLKLGVGVAGQSAGDVIGRYELPFDNCVAETNYRYARLYTLVGGTTPSITYKAFAGIQANGL